MVEKNIRLKTHLGNGVYDTLHPETNSGIVRVGDKNLDETLGEVTAKLAQTDKDLNQRGINIKSFPRLEHEDSDSPRIKRALEMIETDDFTEAIPDEGAKGYLYFPAGRYKITEKIPVTSYMHIKGAGRHATIFDSYITNGDPVFDVRHPDNIQQFYVTLESFTINGRYQNTKGVSIYRTSRWILRDVMVDSTLQSGYYIDRSFLGEVYSPLVRACGSLGHYAVVLTGTSPISGGSHAVSFYGGEINGGTGTEHAVFMEYGNSSGFFGTTIEGFRNGRGITVKNANAFFVHGCYFELNKEDIVEIGPTLGSSYRDNIHADLVSGSRGVIGVTHAQGLTLSGGYMQGGSDIVKLFDATDDGTGKLHMSNIEPLYTTSFPIAIAPSLLESAKRSGTIIQSYDSDSHVRSYGNQRFVDTVETLGDLSPVGGIKNISGFTRSNIMGSDGSPEGQLIADVGSLALNGSDTANPSNALFLKTRGVNNAGGWFPIQAIQAGTTVSRPTVTTVGYQYFDSTLNKPIWWNGVNWRDGSGGIV